MLLNVVVVTRDICFFFFFYGFLDYYAEVIVVKDYHKLFAKSIDFLINKASLKISRMCWTCDEFEIASRTDKTSCETNIVYLFGGFHLAQCVFMHRRRRFSRLFFFPPPPPP